VRFPLQSAGACVEGNDPWSDAAIATGAADDDLVLEGERRSGELKVGLVEQVCLPHDLASVPVGRDDAGRKASLRDDEIVPQSDAAVAILLLLLRVHLPDNLARRTRPHVDFGDDAPAVHHIHKTVVDEWGELQVFVG
jgi:hypothetical protein